MLTEEQKKIIRMFVPNDDGSAIDFVEGVVKNNLTIMHHIVKAEHKQDPENEAWGKMSRIIRNMLG